MRVGNIDLLSLTAFSRLHWQSLSASNRGWVALAATPGTAPQPELLQSWEWVLTKGRASLCAYKCPFLLWALFWVEFPLLFALLSLCWGREIGLVFTSSIAISSPGRGMGGPGETVWSLSLRANCSMFLHTGQKYRAQSWAWYLQHLRIQLSLTVEWGLVNHSRFVFILRSLSLPPALVTKIEAKSAGFILLWLYLGVGWGLTIKCVYIYTYMYMYWGKEEGIPTAVGLGDFVCPL